MASRIKSGEVRVEGLRELSRALKDLGPDLRKELREANRDVAKHEASRAEAKALSLGGVAAKTAPSVRFAAGYDWAGIAFGGPGYPFAGGAEFGALRYRQFKPWRGNSSDAGYFVYPTIRDDSADRLDEYTDRVNALIERAFPD